MVISSLGDGAFRLQSGERSILIDPTTARLKGDVTLYTRAMLATPDTEPNTVSLPGEYEFGGVEVRGWQRGADKAGVVMTYYLVTWDDIRIAFFGVDGPLPDASALTELEERQPEIVLLPMRTKDEQAWSVKFVKDLEPAVIIPSSYANAKDVTAAFGGGVKTQNGGGIEEKFTFKKKDLENHDQTVVILGEKHA